jgi:hypothetical protein
MKSSPRKSSEPAAFALVITLVTLALLTIIAVAFLASSSLDRTTARSLANRTKADLAAKAAVTAAIARWTDNLSTYPDSATTWETINGNQGTVLYYRDKTPEEAINSSTTAQLYLLPLASGGTAQLFANKNSALPVLDNNNSFDLNHARFSNDTQGWIGAPLGATSRPAFRGQWINQANSDNKVTSRYAYWMEDESFKVNANLLGKTLRGPNSLGDAPSQIPLQGLLKQVFGGSNGNTVASDIFDLRARFPSSLFLAYRDLNQVLSQPTIADAAKFEATIYSGASNLSRSGTKRINLNKVVATSIAAAAIRTQLDQIIKTITYHLPRFGQRFYRNGSNKNSLDVLETSGSLHRTSYLNKIAANIRDYIDIDSQPTIINNDAGLTVRIGQPPTNAIVSQGGGTSGPSEIISIGKERLPFIQEYAFRVRQIVFGPKTGPFADYRISIDHYIEFWNSSNRDIVVSDLGPNPFLLIANQPGWDAGSLDDVPEGQPRDLHIALPTNLVFPAGAVTVISTDTTLLPALTPNAAQVYQATIPEELRTYSGRTDRKSGSNLRLNKIDRTTSSSDYETEIALGNDLGILESAWGAGCLSTQMSINIDNASENRFDDTKYHFLGGSLRGNTGTSAPNATTGDPRTNAEQIRFDLNGGSAGNDKTRYFSSELSNNDIPSGSTLTAPNSNYVNPASWPDYSTSTQSANGAPAIIANANLASIGQLGDLFDPARAIGESNNVTLSRGGGRTLKIGQPDRYDASSNANGLWDGDSNSVSREWAAWRLTDIFCTSDALQLDGRININGVARDNGAALKTALYGYNFHPLPDSDPNLAGKPFAADPTNPTDKVNVLVTQIHARLKNQSPFDKTVGPFAERGELSEMPIFNTGSNLAQGINTAVVYDRGREELFRRLVELITTRGNVFTVYAVGQALIPPQSGTTPIVASTSQLKVTFRIDPVWNGTTPSDPFNPTTLARFKKPDKYAIKILYAGD